MGPAETTEAKLRALMLSSLDGDTSAYQALLSELARQLKPYFARRLHAAHAADADDLVQETLMAIHSRRLTYDRDKPFTAWLYAIAHYKFVDHVRRHARRATVPLDDAPNLLAEDGDGVAARLDLESALQAVPARTGQLIYRVKVEGATVGEAARAAGISENAAKVSIHRGLKLLRARFLGRSDD